MAVDRKQLWLGALLVVAVAVAAWQFWPSGQVAAGARPPARDRGRQNAQAEVPKPVEPVKLNALTASASEPGEAARNPFRFQAKVAPPPPRPERLPPARRRSSCRLRRPDRRRCRRLVSSSSASSSGRTG